MSDCVFCRIVKHEISAQIVSEGADWLAFRDLNPQAPDHILIIPKTHIESLAFASQENATLLGQLLLGVQQVSRLLGVESSGYRVAINVGPDAGQSVNHLHVHILGRRKLSWPPG